MKIGINSLLIPLGYVLIHALLAILFGPKDVVRWYPPAYGIIVGYFLAVLYYHSILLAANFLKTTFTKAVLLCAAIYLAILLAAYLLDGRIELGHLLLCLAAAVFQLWLWPQNISQVG